MQIQKLTITQKELNEAVETFLRDVESISVKVEDVQKNYGGNGGAYVVDIKTLIEVEAERHKAQSLVDTTSQEHIDKKA